ALAAVAARLLPERTILCHISAGQPKKQWSVQNWATLHRMATAAGLQLAFTTGRGERDRALGAELEQIATGALILPPAPDLALFLAVLRRARGFISGDTGPLHFAAGLGVPTIALFGPTPAVQWAPLGPQHQALCGGPCRCDGCVDVCQSASHCLAAISPEQVF